MPDTSWWKYLVNSILYSCQWISLNCEGDWNVFYNVHLHFSGHLQNLEEYEIPKEKVSSLQKTEQLAVVVCKWGLGILYKTKSLTSLQARRISVSGVLNLKMCFLSTSFFIDPLFYMEIMIFDVRSEMDFFFKLIW